MKIENLMHAGPFAHDNYRGTIGLGAKGSKGVRTCMKQVPTEMNVQNPKNGGATNGATVGAGLVPARIILKFLNSG